MKLTLDLSVMVGGRLWFLFDYEYVTPDGVLTGYFYAVSQDHAAILLSEMKERATLGGQIVGCGSL